MNAMLLKLIIAVHTKAADIREDKGATATEYALLVSFIAIAIIVGVTAFGTALSDFFNNLAGRVTK
jgi:pilus assembly protein Flp/PilA